MSQDHQSGPDPVSSESAASPSCPSGNGVNRRDLLAGSLAGGLGAGALGAEALQPAQDDSLFLPKEVWEERMKAPDDGKKYGWVVDTRKCFGCHACEVACKAENDVPLGSFIRQTIYHDHEKEGGSQARIMVPMACHHCEDAPCIKACPCGAMHKGPGGSVQVNYDKCSGHAACKEACPYGAIYIDPVANQAVKCHNCTHRIEHDMTPACESTCPSEALFFGDLNDPESRASIALAAIDADEPTGLQAERLREEEKTEPRMWFVTDKDHPMDTWETKIPGKGQSYHPDAYSVYEWKEGTPPHERVAHPVDEMLAAREEERDAEAKGGQQ